MVRVKRKDFMLVIRNVNPAAYAELKKMAVEDEDKELMP